MKREKELKEVNGISLKFMSFSFFFSGLIVDISLKDVRKVKEEAVGDLSI